MLTLLEWVTPLIMVLVYDPMPPPPEPLAVLVTV
jgi:hypothetical protein